MLTPSAPLVSTAPQPPRNDQDLLRKWRHRLASYDCIIDHVHHRVRQHDVRAVVAIVLILSWTFASFWTSTRTPLNQICWFFAVFPALQYVNVILKGTDASTRSVSADTTLPEDGEALVSVSDFEALCRRFATCDATLQAYIKYLRELRHVSPTEFLVKGLFLAALLLGLSLRFDNTWLLFWAAVGTFVFLGGINLVDVFNAVLATLPQKRKW